MYSMTLHTNACVGRSLLNACSDYILDTLDCSEKLSSSMMCPEYQMILHRFDGKNKFGIIAMINFVTDFFT